MTPHINRRRVIFFLVVVPLLILLSVLLFRYLFSGKIIVTTNDPANFITVTNMDGKVIKQSQSKLSATLRTGEYIVSVHGKIVSINQTVNLGVRKTLRYNLNPPDIAKPEPVASKNAHSIFADATQLLYINTLSGKLTRLDEANNLTRLDNTHSLQRVKWSDANYGIGQDEEGRLYVIANGSVRPMETPKPYDSSKSVNFAVTKTRQIYVSFGSSIYYGSENASYKKIYSSETSSPGLISSENGIIIIDTKTYDGEPVSASISSVSTDGKLIKKMAVPVYDDFSAQLKVSWSPDSQKLAVTNGDTVNKILNKSLQDIEDLPNKDITGTVWLDNNTLVYSVGNTIWSYSVSTKKSVVIATLIPGTSVNEMAISEDKSYIYLSGALEGKQEGLIERIGLKGQNASEVVSRLRVFLPVSLLSCSISFVNFTAPTILMHVDIETPRPETLRQDCKSETETELQQDGFNLSSLQLRFAQ